MYSGRKSCPGKTWNSKQMQRNGAVPGMSGLTKWKSEVQDDDNEQEEEDDGIKHISCMNYLHP